MNKLSPGFRLILLTIATLLFTCVAAPWLISLQHPIALLVCILTAVMLYLAIGDLIVELFSDDDDHTPTGFA